MLGPMASEDGTTPSPSRPWQVAAHLSGLVGLVGVPSVVGPLVVWLIRREDPDVEPHAREALNFHLSLVVYALGGVVVALILLFTIIGVVLLPLLLLIFLVLVVAGIALSILGAVRASEGTLYRYPLNLRLIRQNDSDSVA